MHPNNSKKSYQVGRTHYGLIYIENLAKNRENWSHKTFETGPGHLPWTRANFVSTRATFLWTPAKNVDTTNRHGKINYTTEDWRFSGKITKYPCQI